MYPKDKKRLKDREIGELHGLGKGIVADGVVNQAEAEELLEWLQLHLASESDDPLVKGLMSKVAVALEDGVLDEDEAEDLLDAVVAFTGGIQEGGELPKSTTLPLDEPPPQVVFEGKHFLLTGTFSCCISNRNECEKEIEARKGKVLKGIRHDVDYVVVGTYATDAWKHGSYGKKIEKAIKYREKYCRLAIISEKYFLKALEESTI